MPCAVFRFPVVFVLAALASALAGCSTPKSSYEKEDFAQNNTYSRAFTASSTAACDAGRRALLSQGYNIDKFEASRVTGHKNFQSEEGQHTQINFNIDCAADGGSSENATVFANAVQDRYSIKRTSSSASVGLSVLGQVSMPFGASDDSLVKTASQTVARPKFYEGFFDLLQNFLPDAQAASNPHPAAPKAKPGVAKTVTPPPAPPVDPAPSPEAPADKLNPAATGVPDPAHTPTPAVAPAAAPAASSAKPADTAIPVIGSASAPGSTASTPAPSVSVPASQPTAAPATVPPASAPATAPTAVP